MGMFDHSPYTNFHELNLDWMLQALKEIEHTMDQFVAINSLKYADPIQWNIVRQYEKNTIVIDPLTGSAYISVQAVPSGVALTNTDYWTIVFDLGIFVTRAAKNFTNRWEEDTTLTATFPTSAGEWLVWGDTLYRALVNITAGDQYVVDSNIKHFTMEELYNNHVTEFTLKILNILGSIGVNELDATAATQDFNAGVLVWVSGQLYMTLTPILAGSAFIPGTNVTPVRVDDYVLDRVNNAENRLRGSIGVNELDSSVATQNIAAGTLVWFNGELYITLTNINAGDTFTPGTNITTVNLSDFVNDRVNNAENRLRGSIGLNELDSLVATQNIAAGSLVWVSNQLYMAITNINAGDTFNSGTNITPVRVDDYILDRLNTLDISLKAYSDNNFKKVRINSINFSERVALFVGDSYGDPDVIGATCFPDYVGQWLGLKEYHNLCVSGAGFYSTTPSLMYISQLINYTGDRDAVTDIFVIAGLNDSKAITPTDSFYTATANEMVNFNNYVRANYTNANITYGYIGNMRDSYVLSVDPTDPRTYLARKCGMQVAFDNANNLGWTILPYCEAILSRYEGYIGADGIHPTSDGEIELARGIANAIRSGNPVSYIYDYPCVTPYNMTINNGDMLFTVENRQVTFRLNGIRLNAANMTIGQNITPLYFTRNWFNAPVCEAAYIRMYDTQIGDVVVPANFIFNENIMRIDFLGIFNDGAQATYVGSYTFGANGFIEIPAMTITCDATMLA